MRSLGLLSQILTVAMSVAIALLFIRPTLEDIGTTQNKITEYQTQRQKIEKVNTTLAQNVATVASFNPAKVERLTTYMPAAVDDIGVMRELQYVAETAGLVFKTVSYNGPVDRAEMAEQNPLGDLVPTPHSFGLVAEGAYEQMLNFLSLLELNDYPLEVHRVSFTPLEGGFLSLEVDIITYENTFAPLDVN